MDKKSTYKELNKDGTLPISYLIPSKKMTSLK